MNDTQILSLLLLFAIPGCLSQCQEAPKPCPETPQAEVIFWEVRNTSEEEAFCVASTLEREKPSISFIVKPGYRVTMPLPAYDYRLVITDAEGNGSDRCNRKVFPQIGDTLKSRW